MIFDECPRGASKDADAGRTIFLERASGDSVSESILPVKWKSGTQGKERSEGRIRECHARKTLSKTRQSRFWSKRSA